MHSYLLVNFEKQQVKEKIIDITGLTIETNHWENHPDILHLVSESTSIKIDQIRQLQTDLQKNPFHLPFQLGVIWQADKLTVAAQNALLKLLEEPGKQVKMFLVSNNYTQLLPTILSRCELVKEKDSSAKQNNIDTAVLDQLSDLSQQSKTSRMIALEVYTKDRGKTKEWIQKNMIILEQILIGQNQNDDTLSQISISDLLKRLQIAYNDLSANLNMKLVLDQLAIDWDSKLDERLA